METKIKNKKYILYYGNNKVLIETKNNIMKFLYSLYEEKAKDDKFSNNFNDEFEKIVDSKELYFYIKKKKEFYNEYNYFKIKNFSEIDCGRYKPKFKIIINNFDFEKIKENNNNYINNYDYYDTMQDYFNFNYYEKRNNFKIKENSFKILSGDWIKDNENNKIFHLSKTGKNALFIVHFNYSGFSNGGLYLPYDNKFCKKHIYYNQNCYVPLDGNTDKKKYGYNYFIFKKEDIYMSFYEKERIVKKYKEIEKNGRYKWLANWLSIYEGTPKKERSEYKQLEIEKIRQEMSNLKEDWKKFRHCFTVDELKEKIEKIKLQENEVLKIVRIENSNTTILKIGEKNSFTQFIVENVEDSFYYNNNGKETREIITNFFCYENRFNNISFHREEARTIEKLIHKLQIPFFMLEFEDMDKINIYQK